MDYPDAAIEYLTEVMLQSPSIDVTAWLMVAITSVYVIATIFICVANFSSAKATRAQVAEQKRQFDETNRPYVDITIDAYQGSYLGFSFCNTGKKLARNVRVELPQSFIDKIADEWSAHINNLTKSNFVLGVGQVYVTRFCRLSEQRTFDAIQIKLSYSDDVSNYTDEIIFEPAQINWQLIDTTDLAQIRKHMKNVSKHLEHAATQLSEINRQLGKDN